MEGKLMSEVQKKSLIDIIKKCWYLKVALVVVLVALFLLMMWFGIGRTVSAESETTNLDFENIGELVTQSAYCKEVGVENSSRDLFGVELPFTQSKYIYSCGIKITAGLDFGEVVYEVNEEAKTITVQLPQIRVMNREADYDSFEVYHEEQSIFNRITLEENNELYTKLVDQAEQDALENGLLENARTNAEEILKAFFAQQYDLNEYQFVFTDK